MKRCRWLWVLIPGLLVVIALGMWVVQRNDQKTTSAPQTTRAKQTSKKVKAKPAAKPAKPATANKQSQSVTTMEPLNGKLTEAQAIEQIDALVKRHKIMGTLLITTNGPAGVRIRTYGYADLTSRIPNTKTEAYPLASLQKAITATVIQHLINKGKLTMNTPLSKFYPQVPYADQITIRQLLDHRSGLRMQETMPKKVLPSETAQINYTLSHLTSTNDHVYAYTNANYTMLAGVIRKVSHKSYMTMLQNVILRPLNLKHTFAYDDIPGNVVNPLSYRLSDGNSQGTIISKPLQSSELGCGSLYMSVGDYYTFMHALQSGKLVGQAGLKELSNHFAQQYSAGVYYQPENHIRVGGNDNAFHTFYMGTREGRIGLALFENQGDFHGDNQVAYAIQRILMRSEKF